MRCTKREVTVGAPASLAARVEDDFTCAPSACAKSCAERPMRRSGGSRPRSRRIGRLSQGSLRVSGGQVPSFSPPSTTRSTVCRRASSGPRMRTRTSATFRPAHHAVADGGVEQLGIVATRDREAGGGRAVDEFFEGVGKRGAVVAGEGRGLAVAIFGAERGDRRRDGIWPVRRADARRLSMFPAAPARRRACRSARPAASSSSSAISQRGSLRCKSSRVGAEGCERVRKAACSGARARAAQQRAFKRGNRGVDARRCRCPSRSSGCLSSASSVTGSRPPSAASAASRANTPAAVSASESPPESSTFTSPAFQRGDDAARQRAVGRHQRGGFALRLERLAQGDRDGERFFLGIGGLDQAIEASALSGGGVEVLVGTARAASARWWRPGASASDTSASRPSGFGQRS